MTERKMNRRKAARKARNRRVALTLCLMLAVCVVSVGGTIAWLTASTAPVVNTFAPSDIAIDLKETKNSDGTVADRVTDWNAELVPGMSYPKNPVVSVIRPDTDVDIYLFVKVEETHNALGTSTTEKIVEYDLTLDNADSGWALVEGTTDVWWRTVAKDDVVISWDLINGNTVTINDDLTKELMPEDGSTPALSFTAYAIQTHGMENAKDAWSKLNP